MYFAFVLSASVKKRYGKPSLPPTWEAIDNAFQDCDKFWTCDKAAVIHMAVHFAKGFCRLRLSNLLL